MIGAMNDSNASLLFTLTAFLLFVFIMGFYTPRIIPLAPTPTPAPVVGVGGGPPTPTPLVITATPTPSTPLPQPLQGRITIATGGQVTIDTTPTPTVVYIRDNTHIYDEAGIPASSDYLHIGFRISIQG